MAKARALIAGDGCSACVSLQANLQALGLVADIFDSCRPIEIFQKCRSGVDNAESEYSFLFVGVRWVLAGGHDFASEMRNHRQSCSSPAVIGIVPRDQPAITKRCLDMGMADVIAAPFYLDALYESICSIPNSRDPETHKETGSSSKLDPCLDNLVELHDGLMLSQDFPAPAPAQSQHRHSEPISAAKQDPAISAVIQGPAVQQVDGPATIWQISAHLSSCIAQKPARNASIDIVRQLPWTSEEVVLPEPDTWALPANRSDCIA